MNVLLNNGLAQRITFCCLMKQKEINAYVTFPFYLL